MSSTQTPENMSSITDSKAEDGQQQAYGAARAGTSSTKSTPPSTATITRDIKRIRRYLNELQRHRAQVLDSTSPPTTAELPTALERRLDRLEIGYSLGKAMEYLALKLISLAKKEAHHALQIADRLDNELDLARCFYWLGRIEFQQWNLAAAHSHFRAARLCVLDGEHPESCSVVFYLDASRPKALEDDRGHHERGPSDHRPVTHGGGTSQSTPQPSSSRSRQKRKRESTTWDLPLRPSG